MSIFIFPVDTCTTIFCFIQHLCNNSSSGEPNCALPEYQQSIHVHWLSAKSYFDFIVLEEDT